MTSVDRKLLFLLGQLVLETEAVDDFSNRSIDFVHLSNTQAEELLLLLEQFVESKRFQETAYLVEELFSGNNTDRKDLRDIYLSWRKRQGKSRALATDQWEAFRSRLGIAPRNYGGQLWYRTNATPMGLDYFLRMEKKLANVSGLSPRVQELIISYIRLQFGYLQSVRMRETKLERGQIATKPKSLIETLRMGKTSKLGAAPLSTTRIAATLTIVLDLSAAYTTRDWSVASFISTIAGAAPATILD